MKDNGITKFLTNNDTFSAARIHLEGMSQDFLPSFGIGFLNILHTHFLKSPDAICLGYYKKSRLYGVIVGCTDTSRFLKKVVTRGFWQFLPIVLPKLILSPKKLYYVLQTLFYGQDKFDTSKSELIILSVSKEVRRQGIGTILLKALKKEFKQQHITSFKVGALSTNQTANTFYQKLGGVFSHTISIYGKKWNVYKYDFYNSV